MTNRLMGSAEFINGVCWVRLSRRADPSRKRIEIEQPGITRDEAKLLAHQMSLEMIRRKLSFPKPPATSGPGENVADYAIRWLDDRVARKVIETRRHDKGRLSEHVSPIIGDWPIATVTREKIEEIVLALDAKVVAEDMSWKTAANVWGVVSKLFADARASKNPKLRVRDDDPTDGVSPPERGGEKSKAFLYPSEFWKLITSRTLTHGEGLPAHVAANVATASRRWLRSFVLAAYLGTRAGELAALDWQDIDLEHWTVFIHTATERATRRKKEKETKTGITRRFEIEPALRPLLLAMWREQGKPKSGKVIALPPEGDLSSRLKRYLEWAGVERAELFISDATRCAITFKDLRATYATWRAIRGDDPLKIQRAAGHKSLNTTQIYIRAAEDLGGRAGAPFPPLPPFVLGSTAAPRAHLEGMPGGGGKRARPKPVPKLSQETGKQAKLNKKVASPAGFENTEAEKTPPVSTVPGQLVPQNPTKPTLNLVAKRARAELWRALADSIADKRTSDAMALAARLASDVRGAAPEMFADGVPAAAETLRKERA